MTRKLRKFTSQSGKTRVYEGELYRLTIRDDETIYDNYVHKFKRPLFETISKESRFIPSISFMDSLLLDKNKPFKVKTGTTSYFNIELHEVEEVAEYLLKAVNEARLFEEVLAKEYAKEGEN